MPSQRPALLDIKPATLHHPYQEVHGPGQLLGHLQLPQDVNQVPVLLQVGVQCAKLYILLHHDI